MFQAKQLVLTLLLILHLGFAVHADKSSEENDEEVYIVTGKKGTLKEHLSTNFEKVKELKIINCQFQDVSIDAFKPMTNLKKIVIKNSEIDKLQEGLFQACPKLKEIEIKRTKIHHLDDETFVNLTKLEEIEFEGSSIKLKDEMFSGCSRLEELQINDCEVTSPNLEAFNGINLHEFELKNNKIEEFSFRNFPKMTNLKVISLSGNPLSSFDITGIQEKCPNLRKIKLKKTNVSPDTIEQLQSFNIRVKTGD